MIGWLCSSRGFAIVSYVDQITVSEHGNLAIELSMQKLPKGQFYARSRSLRRMREDLSDLCGYFDRAAEGVVLSFLMIAVLTNIWIWTA